MVGFVNLYPVFSSVNLTRQWILNDLFVVPEARKLGVGRVLMERAHQLAVPPGQLPDPETATDNLPAQKPLRESGLEAG